MCLIVVRFGRHPDVPLLVGANRDERLEREAVAVTVLSERGPRILGGRDLVAGGTWLAVNEHGVVAGLTNRPSPNGRDPTKRSRGELPLALARHRSAEQAVEDFVSRFVPGDYNLAWLLVGDRASLFSVEMADDKMRAEALAPGTYVLGNGPLHERSPKTDHVRRHLAGLEGTDPATARATLLAVLADHSIPPEVAAEPEASDRPKEYAAACVHVEGYGTRSSAIVEVPGSGLPHMWVADGSPCSHPFEVVDRLWCAPVGAVGSP